MIENNLKKICVISTKDPTNILIGTVINLKKFYDDFDIVLVDSDSKDTNSNIFKMIPDFVKIEFIKNKNFELGAYHYAFNKYDDYDVYMFIQDNFTPVNFYEFDYKNIVESDYLYFFKFRPTYTDYKTLPSLNYYIGSEFDYLTKIPNHSKVLGCLHNSFVTNKKIAKEILKLENIYLEKNIKKTKKDSWLTEKTFAIVGSKHTNNIIDMQPIGPYFIKTHGHRDYNKIGNKFFNF